MATINISNDNDDPFFRYKMPKVILKHEGKGNGVKTVISNVKDVAKSLNRDVGDVLQYVATELSVCSIVKNDDYIVNGTFEVKAIQDIIAKFVSTHVLCDICGNPETILTAKTGNKKDIPSIYKRCMACGGKSKVKSHKINKRIKTEPLVESKVIADDGVENIKIKETT